MQTFHEQSTGGILEQPKGSLAKDLEIEMAGITKYMSSDGADNMHHTFKFCS